MRPPASARRAGRTVNRQIFGAAVAIGAGTLVVRLLGLVKNQVIANAFGTSDDVEAFFLALMLPTFAVGVLGNYLPVAIVPVYSRVELQEGHDASRRLVRDFGGWALLVLAATTAALGLFGGLLLPAIASGFPPDKLARAMRLFQLLLPSLFIQGVAFVWIAFLDARKRFVAPVLGQASIPIATAVCAAVMAERWGAAALVAGHLGGGLIQLVVLGVLMRTDGGVLPRRPRRSPAVSEVLRHYMPAVGGGFLMNSTRVVDQSMAAMLPAGSLAALAYANVVVAGVLAVGASALGRAILPYLSDMASARDWRGIRHSLRSYLGLVAVVTLPLTVVLIVVARPVVELFFQHGAFDAQDSEAVTFVLRMYFVQIPFFTTAILLIRVVSSLGQNRVLLWLGALNLVDNVLLNLAFSRIWGVAGIALSTSVVYMVYAAVLFWFVRRQLAVAEARRPAPAPQGE